ncbi:MAG: hypothetical protein RL758_274 [Pseudomonadota bacterium]|jgi:hypothetical protein
MSAAIIATVGAAAIGAMNAPDGPSQTSTNQADPRFNKLLYGSDNQSGLMGAAADWYKRNKSGMNPQMLQALNDQFSTLSDPGLKAGYQQIQNLGLGLMGSPVASNPFTGGGTLMAPGLQQSSVVRQAPANSLLQQPGERQTGGLLGGPFAMPEVGGFDAKPVDPKPVDPYASSFLDPYQQQIQDYWKKVAEGTMTPEDSAKFNSLTMRNAG